MKEKDEEVGGRERETEREQIRDGERERQTELEGKGETQDEELVFTKAPNEFEIKRRSESGGVGDWTEKK